MGNYHSFGHSKFVPEVDPSKFRAILFSNPLYEIQGSLYREYLDKILPLVEKEIFALESPYSQLGFPYQGGVTGYFSPTMTADDLTLIRDFFSEHKISPLNTRAFKISEGKFVITVGSIDKSLKDFTFRGAMIKFIHGEFGPFLEEVN